MPNISPFVASPPETDMLQSVAGPDMRTRLKEIMERYQANRGGVPDLQGDVNQALRRLPDPVLRGPVPLPPKPSPFLSIKPTLSNREQHESIDPHFDNPGIGGLHGGSENKIAPQALRSKPDLLPEHIEYIKRMLQSAPPGTIAGHVKQSFGIDLGRDDILAIGRSLGYKP